MNNLIPKKSNLTQSDTTDESGQPAEPVTGNPLATKPLGRRRALKFGGAAALAGGAAALMSKQGAAGAATAVGLPAATTGVMRYGANNGSGQANTSLLSSNTKFTFHVKNAGLGHAVFGEASNPDGNGYGVLGVGDGGAGVVGGTRGNGPGIRAYVQPGASGSAFQAVTLEPHNSSPTVWVLQGGVGHGLYSHIENANNAARAIYGRTIGIGHAVLASVLNAQSDAAATKSVTQGAGPGIDASSAKGVGGTFAGKTAQVRLVPSSDASHPASGSSGQLFVDSGNRLWFCRGGSSWQQLA